MPILLAMDLPLASEVPFQQTQPFESFQMTAPLELESSVETFDPEARAEDLAATLPRQWCGTYKSFAEGSVVEASLTLTSATPMGQMVDLRGEMRLGSVTTPLQGNLNAKSDQLELLPLAEELIPGVESGGVFMGLQAFSLSGWEPPRLTNPGGRLELTESCSAKTSEALPVRGLW
ncbi:MAG: hypothetical protein AB8A46_01680 [Prochlorococcus sp.]|nr:hypothetical protein [Prochlorococcaceae cyanobacterium ETNP18_MAG_1]CAI8168206.1 MAG: Uncharacterised protein [Prochlorococcus marinus str. MIT 9215]